jgi:hypothetical protein
VADARLITYLYYTIKLRNSLSSFYILESVSHCVHEGKLLLCQCLGYFSNS